MASARDRVLDAMVAELKTVAGIGTVGKDLRAWEELTGDEFPAAFVVAGSGGPVEGQPAKRMRESMPIAVWGYVKSAIGTADGVSAKREGHYQAVVNALLGTGMQTRLDADLTANGQNGAILLEQAAGPDTDEGQTPPFGVFRLPVTAVLHYARGSL